MTDVGTGTPVRRSSPVPAPAPGEVWCPAQGLAGLHDALSVLPWPSLSHQPQLCSPWHWQLLTPLSQSCPWLSKSPGNPNYFSLALPSSARARIPLRNEGKVVHFDFYSFFLALQFVAIFFFPINIFFLPTEAS